MGEPSDATQQPAQELAQNPGVPVRTGGLGVETLLDRRAWKGQGLLREGTLMNTPSPVAETSNAQC